MDLVSSIACSKPRLMANAAAGIRMDGAIDSVYWISLVAHQFILLQEQRRWLTHLHWAREQGSAQIE